MNSDKGNAFFILYEHHGHLSYLSCVPGAGDGDKISRDSVEESFFRSGIDSAR